MSGFAVAVAVEEREKECGPLLDRGSLVCGVVKAVAHCANAIRINDRFICEERKTEEEDRF